jgi:hypothetical protein
MPHATWRRPRASRIVAEGPRTGVPTMIFLAILLFAVPVATVLGVPGLVF